MYKNILVPLDGSKRSERILPHAKELALQLEARIALLQVVERETDGLHPRETLAEPSTKLQKMASQEAEEYLSGLKGEFRDNCL
jgi:nucleotide-binding universal stress UspA family protein